MERGDSRQSRGVTRQQAPDVTLPVNPAIYAGFSESRGNHLFFFGMPFRNPSISGCLVGESDPCPTGNKPRDKSRREKSRGAIAKFACLRCGGRIRKERRQIQLKGGKMCLPPPPSAASFFIEWHQWTMGMRIVADLMSYTAKCQQGCTREAGAGSCHWECTGNACID